MIHVASVPHTPDARTVAMFGTRMCGIRDCGPTYLAAHRQYT